MNKENNTNSKNPSAWWSLGVQGIGGVAQGLGKGAHNKVGDGLKTVAPVFNVIPGWGPLISAAVDTLGSGVNALTGTNMNDQFVESTKSIQNQLSSLQADTSSFESLSQQASSIPTLGNITKDQVGVEGPWAKAFGLTGISDTTEELNAANMNANNIARSNINAGANLLKQRNFFSNMKNSYSKGGQISPHTNGGYFSNGLTYIGEGGTHEENPYEGVFIGTDSQGVPNMVEEGEYIWNDYVFSNRLKIPMKYKNILSLGSKSKGYTFAEAVDSIQKESEERPNDPISKNGLMANLYKLQGIQEQVRQTKEPQQQQLINKFDNAGPIDKGGTLLYPGNAPYMSTFLDDYSVPVFQEELPIVKSIPTVKEVLTDKYNNLYGDVEFEDGLGNIIYPTFNYISPTQFGQTWKSKTDPDSPLITKKETKPAQVKTKVDPNANLRYWSALQNMAQGIADLFTEPDYSNAEAIEGLNLVTPKIAAPRNSVRLKYNPIDPYAQATTVGTQGLTAMNLLSQSAVSNPALQAQLIGLNYLNQQEKAKAFREGIKLNIDNKNTVAEKNAALESADNQLALEAAKANQNAANANNAILLDKTNKAVALRQAEDQAYAAAISGNRDALNKDITGIGQEAYAYNQIVSNPTLGYAYDKYLGNIIKKNNSKGGYLTIKRRK